MTSPPTRPPRHKRTYLINPRFQLKYTALLVGVVLTVMLVLGAVIGRTVAEATDYAQLAVAEAERAMNESRSNSTLAHQNVVLAAADNPELVKMMDEANAEADKKAERDLDEVRSRKGIIVRQKARTFTLLAGSCVLLALLLGAMGILITHRVVGPVHKLKRLLRQVGTGRLGIRERLREGDELSDLFETFLQMTYSLKAMQKSRVATLDDTIRDAAASGASPEVMDGLRALRAQMVLGLSSGRRSSIPAPSGGP
jgi:methyl-accepting chemotaxis protein